MRVLIHVNHPAQVHLFKNLAWELERRGHAVLWTTCPINTIFELLERYKFEYEVISSVRKEGYAKYISMANNLIKRDLNIFKLVNAFKVDVMIGTSIAIAHVSRLTRAKSIVFEEDDAAAITIFALLSYPFADTICTPDCLKDDFGRKHVKYPSYHELAYLHPNHFSPNPEVMRNLKVTEDDSFFILRFVSFQAMHDVRQSGIGLTMSKKLIQELSKYGKIFITSDRKLPPEQEKYRIPIPPYQMHDVLYYATMYIGDSQTMAAEAAVLGTPAIRCNTFVGRCSTLDELEHKYGLTHGFLPKYRDKMFDKIIELLNKPNLKLEWQEKRKKMLKDKIDLTGWMVDFMENYPESVKSYQGRR